MTNKRFFTQKSTTSQDTHKRIGLTNRLKKLHRRFAKSTYCEKNKGWMWFAYIVGILLCVISIAGSFYGTYSLFRFIVQDEILAACFSLALLTGLIYAQRQSSDRFWDILNRDGEIEWRWLLFSLAIFCMNLSSGIYGTYRIMIENVPPPVHQEDELLAQMQAEKDSLDNRIANMENTTWGGTITRNASAAIAVYSQTQNSLTKAILDRSKEVVIKRDTSEEEHDRELLLLIKYTLLLYVVLELLHEACIAYKSYFEFREICEIAGSKENLTRILQIPPTEIQENDLLNVAAERGQPKIGFQIPPQGFNQIAERSMEYGLNARSSTMNDLNAGAAERAERFEIQDVQAERVKVERGERPEVVQKITRTVSIDLTKKKQDLRNGWRRMNKPLPDQEQVGESAYQKALNALKDNTQLYESTAKELKELGLEWTTYENGTLSFA